MTRDEKERKEWKGREGKEGKEERETDREKMVIYIIRSIYFLLSIYLYFLTLDKHFVPY